MNNLFGKVINVEKDTIFFENLSKQANLQYLNFHVAIPDNNGTFIGEIVSINEDIIKVLLVGIIINNKFISGVVKKPANPNNIRFLNKLELELMIGRQGEFLNQICIGESSIYNGYYVSANTNEFLANHFAILGNTGSGKSCGMAHIIQDILKQKEGKIPENAHILLFDAYGEYQQAFKNLTNTIGINTKTITTDLSNPEDKPLRIPFFLLSIDDLALLLNVESTSQLQILEKAKKLVYIFKSEDENSRNYKNNIIADCVMDILTSGRNTTQIRDQVIAVLSRYYTEDLSVNSIIHQPGYDRTLRQCLNIDDQGKMASMPVVVEFIEQFLKVDFDDIEPNFNFSYSLDDFYDALEFALISEGTINSNVSYEKNNNLKNRLLNIINNDYKEFFTAGEFMTEADFVNELFMKNNDNCQLVNINISGIDDRLAKTITKIYSRIIFEYTCSLKNRGSYSVHILLEEAHRYIHNDIDNDVLGYNIFERISKEGRKYGTILGLITQRPSELSSTVLSQCTNFITFRIFHPEDLKIIEKITTNLHSDMLEKIKLLEPGSCIVFGPAFPLSTIVKVILPNPTPNSSSVDITNNWYM